MKINPPVSTHPQLSLNTVRNRLLAALPVDQYERIAPALEIVPLRFKDILHKPGERMWYVYFPGGGFCSIVTVLADGHMVEIATIGREGMLGVSAMDQESPPTSITMVQGGTDTCYRMTVAAFRSEVERRQKFADLMAHFAQALFGFVAQSTACNAVHSLQQRLARWLLMAQDRMESEQFPLTQEFASMMLGTSRPTVSVVAGALQKAGLIRYRRGHVTIVNRQKLEAMSCECYRTVSALLINVTGNCRPVI